MNGGLRHEAVRGGGSVGAKKTLLQAALYFFSGGSAFVSYMAMLYFFTEWLHLYHLVSLVVAYALSICVNFVISKYVVFARRGGGERAGRGGPAGGHIQTNMRADARRELVRFCAVALVGLALQFVIVFLLTNLLLLQYFIANVIGSALVYLVSFSLHKFFTFSAKHE